MKGKMAKEGGKDCFKKGGAVEKKEEKKEEKHEEKKAHKAHGEHAKKRLDKRARGGRISSPLSGAMPKGMRSNGSENN